MVFSNYLCLLTLINVYSLLIVNNGIPQKEDAIQAYQLGNKFAAKMEYDKAIEMFKSSISYDSTFTYSWTNLGHIYLKIEEFNLAINAFQEVYSLVPNDIKANYNLAVAYHRNNEIQKALNNYEFIVNLYTNRKNEKDSNVKIIESEISIIIKTFYNLGLIYQENNDYETSILYYKETLELNPKHIEARINYCNILYSLEMFDNAEICYLDVLSIQPDYVRALINLASLYSRSFGNMYNFMNQNKCTERDNCEDIDISNNKIVIEKALLLYTQALSLDPTNPMAKHGLKSLKAAISTLNNKSNNNDIDKLTYDESNDLDYIRELFDSYSFQFDSSLSKLNYSTPHFIANALQKHIHFIFPYFLNKKNDDNINNNVDNHAMRILDLGSGTGLVCDPLINVILDTNKNNNNNNLSVNITGIDVSSKMLLKASEKNCYNALFVVDIQSYLNYCILNNEKFHLIVAADVLVYMDDLFDIFQLVRQSLMNRMDENSISLFIFTVENNCFSFENNSFVRNGCDNNNNNNKHILRNYNQNNYDNNIDGYNCSYLFDRNSSNSMTIHEFYDHNIQYMYGLQGTGRYAHSRWYLEYLACYYGFYVLEIIDIVPRLDQGAPVHGLLVVLAPNNLNQTMSVI
eukprot:gene16918-23219_t